MSKVRIITFHTPKNYGAVLQAFSLMCYLNNLSEDVKVIDYNTPHLRSIYPIKVKYPGIKGKIKMILELTTYHGKKLKYTRFDDFVSENFILTNRFESTADLYNNAPDGDLFITGSDQVFNPNRIADERKVFYLDFVPSSAKRISYAASFGCDTIREEEKNEINHYLLQFYKISVREPSGLKIVKELSKQEATIVLDPVFLNDIKFWNAYVEKVDGIKGDYLLYYRLMSNRERDKNVLHIAKDRKIKIVAIVDGLCFLPGVKILRDVGPEEFLWLFKNASFVATDSFHGVAFSLIFEKQFVFLDKNEHTNERGLSLLKTAGIINKAYISNYKNEIDISYDDVNLHLKPSIELSKKFLMETINE